MNEQELRSEITCKRCGHRLAHDARFCSRCGAVVGGCEVVGEVEDRASALAAVAALRPAVVLLDIQLPDLDGFAVAVQLPVDGPTVVLTSSRSASSFRRRLAAHPTWRFVPKSELSGEAAAAAVTG